MLKKLFAALSGKKEELSKENYDYSLESLSGEDGGSGLVIKRLYDNQRLQWRSLAKSSGLYSMNVAGVSHRAENLQNSVFSPGQTLSLVPEPKNQYDPNAVAVFDKSRKIQIGYLPKEDAKYFSQSLQNGQQFNCIAMWETIKKKKRVGLRILIVEDDVKLKLN